MPQLVWLITGCSSGIGETLTLEILARGDHVIATARKLESIKHLEQAGARILSLDVNSDQSSLNAVMAEAINFYGRVDVLVNNAAYVASGGWEDVDYEQSVAQFNTNVFGPMKVTRALLPHLRSRKSGNIVFIGSTAGWTGNPFAGLYSGSKFALEGIVEALEKEVKPLGIKTLLLEPGRFRTKLLTPGNVHLEPTKIADYAEGSKMTMRMLSMADQRQPGDPKKIAKVMIDLVRKEGCSEGKDAPFRLPLGPDSYNIFKTKCEQTLSLLEEWKSVIEDTDYAQAAPAK